MTTDPQPAPVRTEAAIVALRADYVQHLTPCRAFFSRRDEDCTCGAVQLLDLLDRMLAAHAAQAQALEELSLRAWERTT